MNTLNQKTIKTLDSQNMLGSIEVLQKQCMDAWETTTAIELPENYKSANKIVWLGMGGSALGIDVVKTLFADELTIPVEIISGYNIPATVDADTLVVFSSYSGTTEEVVAAAEEAMKKTKKVFVVTTGGTLAEMVTEHRLPAYIFDPEFNPSNQPRMAIGYSVMATVGLFASLDFISVTTEQVQQMATHLESLHNTFGADVDEQNNPVKEYAQQMHGSIPVLVTAEFLNGAAHVMANQTNENSKQFTIRFQIPEMNHFLLEGLTYPKDKNMTFAFFNSALYHVRNQKRVGITADLVQEKGQSAVSYRLQGKTKFEQAFELILFGGYASFYMAILNTIDPSPIPSVDYFKDELKKA